MIRRNRTKPVPPAKGISIIRTMQSGRFEEWTDRQLTNREPFRLKCSHSTYRTYSQESEENLSAKCQSSFHQYDGLLTATRCSIISVFANEG